MIKTWKKTAAILMAVLLMTGTVAHAEGMNPVAENLELTTYRNISVGGQMRGSDPDGDALSFVVTTEPVKGTLECDESGRFVYTPRENKKGRDYFGYKAVDANGNESQEATAIIRIQRKAPDIQYADTAGLGCGYAAGLLAETGVFTGPLIGSEHYFQPEQLVTRQEFYAMCLAATGLTATEDMSCTADEFCFNDAAVILNDLLQVSSVPCLAADSLPGMTDWSAQAVSNLQACGILGRECSALDTPVTRQEAAELLLRAMTVLAAR